MRIYQATKNCYDLAHSIRNPDTPEWRVIHYMARVHRASKDKIIQDTGVNASVITGLAQKKPPILISS